MKIVLASKSPRRKHLLERIIPKFQVIESRVREFNFKHKTPVQSARANALRKAKRVSIMVRDGLVIGSDTIVVLGRRILGKPRTLAEASRMLASLSGKVHQVITAVVITKKEEGKTEKQIVFHDLTRVRIKTLSPQDISRYIQKVHVLDKAGSYGIQEEPKIAERIWGSYTNVMGLPVEKLRKELKALI